MKPKRENAGADPGAAGVPPDPAGLLAVTLEALCADALAVDAAGRVIFWSRGLEAVAGPASRALGRPLAEVLPRLTDPMRATDFEALLLTEALEHGRPSFVPDYPRRDTAGEVRLHDVSIHPVQGPEGRPAGALCVFLDVTESRRKALRDVRSARTSSLAAFGASIAHEIRNPLNSIALNLQLLQEGIRDLACESRGELIEESGAILEEIGNLDRVVGNLLRFAREPAPSLTEGDAAQAAASALKLLAGEARRAGVRVVRDLRPLDGVRMDEDMLSRAVYNIGLNAIQAMTGGGTLTVRTFTRPHSAVIEIADTGPGIPAENRERIFELFYSGRAGGTGIGLSMAHRIAEGHAGHLTVDDAPGGGAVFQIHLPRGAVPER